MGIGTAPPSPPPAPVPRDQLRGWEEAAQPEGPPEPLRTSAGRIVSPPALWVQGEAAPGLLASDSSLESNRASRLFLAQFLSCLVQLPPILSTTDILWLSCFCYPLLR